MYEDAPRFFNRCRESQNPQRPRVKSAEFVGFCHGYISDLVIGERYADAAGLLSVILKATEDAEVHKLTELLLNSALQRDRTTFDFDGLRRLGRLIYKY